MVLDKKIACTLYEIHVPIWSSKSVGLADYRLSTHNEIRINAKGPDEKKYYPDNYYISLEKARSYPVQSRSGFEMRIIPIRDLEVLERI